MTIHKSLVLTLRTLDYSETSQVVVFLARDAGLLRGLAKGSKRGQNPFGGPLDRWTLAEAVFSLRDPTRLATLMEIYEHERFAGLRDRLAAFYGASLVTEMLLALLPEGDPQPAVFDLAVEALGRLDEAEPAQARALALALAWRLLATLGYAVDMGRCVECGAEIEPGRPVEFSGAVGGPVCPNCRPPGRTVTLTGKAAEAITFLASAEWSEVRRVRLGEPTAKALRAALQARMEELAGRTLSSLPYL